MIYIKPNKMKKSRIILGTIFVFAAIGGAMATKVRATEGAIWNGTTYVPATTQQDCTHAGAPCTYVLPDESLTVFYTFNGTTYLTGRLE